jgi:SAM-dependent methyltransferase
LIRGWSFAWKCIRTGRFDILCYKLRNYQAGIDLRIASLKELGLSEDCAHEYVDSGGPNLARLVKAIRVPKGSRVIDIGSGKGGAVFTLSKFPFEEVVGVEISKDLIAIAEGNQARLGLRNVRFICCDARMFKEFETYSHIYFFNPFPANVMREVMCNVSESLVRKPRSVTLIYLNPVCHDEVINSGLFRMKREFSFSMDRRHLFRVYYHSADDLPPS